MELNHKDDNIEIKYDFDKGMLFTTQKREGIEEVDAVTYGRETMEYLHDLISLVIESREYQNMKE